MILIIEDDPVLGGNIKDALLAGDMQSEIVYDGLLAERVLRKNSYDCIIMDINLPGKNGFDLCKNFREFNTHTPVLMLTAFGELDDKVKGFDCGADDYLTKPFFMRELMLRINSLIKRAKSGGDTSRNAEVLVAGEIVINTATKRVSRQNNEISLSPREYQILLKLVINKGEIIPKSDFIKEIWGSLFDANTNTIEVYINFLRNKIDKPFGKNSIKTRVGFGYYLCEED